MKNTNTHCANDVRRRLNAFARCAAALLLVFSMLLSVLPVLAQGEGVLAESDIP